MSLKEKKIVLKQVLKERRKAALFPVWMGLLFALLKLAGITPISWWVVLAVPTVIAIVMALIVAEVWALIVQEEERRKEAAQ